MEYVDEHGQPAYGVVWSPGPMPGTVWVLPESGASKSSALVVKVASRDQVPHAAVQRYLERNLSDYIGRFKYAPRLPAKAWHEAIGYDPREVVAEDALALDFDAETPAETAAEVVVEPVPASAPSAAPVAAETPPEPVTVPVVAKASDPRNKPPGDTYKGVHTERYIGHTIRIRRGKEWGTFSTSINGHPLGDPYGTTNAAAARELDAARGYVDDAIVRPDNYHNGLGEYAWPKPGQTTMPREAQRAAETATGPVGESVAPAAPVAAPAPSQTSPEPVTVPMAPAALTDVRPPTEVHPVTRRPLQSVSRVRHGLQGSCRSCPGSGMVTNQTSCESCPELDMVNNDDQLCRVSRGGHDPQGLRRVRVPSRSWMRRRPPARPRHPVQTPCPRPLAGHAAHPCPRSQMLVRPPPPRRHHACSIRVCSSRWRPEHRPERVEQCRGPTASGPERRRHPRSGPPGAAPNGVRDELSLRSPTPDGWPRRAASYRKLVARNW